MHVLLCLLLVAVTAHADPRAAVDAEDNISNHPLSPEKLDAIRLIGRHVLQAKNRDTQAPIDKGPLNQLRTSLDNLIAAEASPSPSASHLSRQALNTPSSQPSLTASPAITLRKNQAWDEVGNLRQQAGQLRSRNNKPAKTEVYAAGLPIGEQQGRLYDEWADKLETILSNDNADRLRKLRALRDQLKPEKRLITDTALMHDTPTLQAMPWRETEAPKPQPKTRRKTPSGH